jgi:phosphate transport system ATP-binding protein
LAINISIDKSNFESRGIEDTSSFTPTIIKAENVNVWYGHNKVLEDVNIDINKNRITAFIGPSGCGKTTLLKSINKMNKLIKNFKISGSLKFEEEELYSKNQNDKKIRTKIGMVFQQPNPFPKTIYENMRLPITENMDGISRKKMHEIIEKKLKDAYLYDEVKDRLHKSALGLSGGQQQRLCIARALTIEPEVILFDEPCSALDPISTAKIEDLLLEMKEKYTIVIVTHNLQQASRIADYVAFFYKGKIEEQGPTSEFFLKPKTKLAQEYISGAF